MSFFAKLFGQSSADLTAVEAHTRLSEANPPYLLDVREPHEYHDGHIAGAHLLPLGELGKRLQELPVDREILCVCRSGSRSGRAARQLNSAGLTAINLKGGMIGWQQAGLSVRKGKARKATARKK